MQQYDLIAHLLRQRAFSRATFGPGMRSQGVIDHIRKELKEIEAEIEAPIPNKERLLSEWVDVILLGLDGAWRCLDESNMGRQDNTAGTIAHAIEKKQSKNEMRDWPDWRTADPNKAIEHDRSRDAPSPPADPL